MKEKELADLELELISQTEKAFFVTDGKVRVWLPKSQCEYHEDEGQFTMSVKLAEEKGLL